MTIARISSALSLPAKFHGAVVAIGNFDGVHHGHQAVLETALDAARKAGRPAIVLTFEPHPRAVFRPDEPPSRITQAPMKATIVDAMGFDAIIEHPFDLAFSRTSAETFVSEILCGALGAHTVVAGVDFHFGAGRKGGPVFLMEAGQRAGFAVALVDAYRDDDAEIISSSRIRAHLLEGRIAEANALLGYRFRAGAPISGGKQLGRTLGYPTANMKLEDDTPLAHGIYAVRFQRADGTIHDGVASFGRRPTVDEDGLPLLETYIFDFYGDLYGEDCKVIVCAFLRGEEKFDGLDALTEQMRRDEENARAALAGLAPLSDLDRRLTFGAA